MPRLHEYTRSPSCFEANMVAVARLVSMWTLEIFASAGSVLWVTHIPDHHLRIFLMEIILCSAIVITLLLLIYSYRVICQYTGTVAVQGLRTMLEQRQSQSQKNSG